MIIDKGFWKGWEVYLETKDGARLPENGDITELYIECEHDKEFIICVKGPGAKVAAWLEFCVDGNELMPETYGKGRKTALHVSEAFENIDEVMYARPLVFRRLDRYDDGPALTAKEANDLGTILVTLDTGKWKASNNIYVPPETVFPKGKAIQENSKGPLDSYVGSGTLGSPYIPTAGTWIFKRGFLAHRKSIRMKYATREALIAEGIMEDPIDTLDEKAPACKPAPFTADSEIGRSWCWCPFSALAAKRKAKKVKNSTEHSCYEKTLPTYSASVLASNSESTIVAK